MNTLQALGAHAKQAPKRVLLPEPQDPRVRQAASVLVRDSLAIPVFVETPPEPVPGAVVLAEHTPPEQWAAWHQQAQQRITRQLSRKGDDAVQRGLADPLLMAAALLHVGAADASVAGSIATTADILRAGIKGVGLAPDAALVSSFFLMALRDGRTVTFADCGVVPQPDAAQLAEIAVASAASHQRLTGETPRVALLSFSTKGSARHAAVDHVRQALEAVQHRAPDLLIDGELQFDAAFVPEIAARKAPGSAVAGQANVFVFPDLNSGNIAYKIAERIGGATALGPLLQGMAKPWMDLSRGCSAQDIVDVAVIASALAGDMP